MQQDSKRLYEKIEDYKNYAVILLTVGVFFYLGVMIPFEAKTELGTYIMMAVSAVFLAGSCFFFHRSKINKEKLIELEEEL